MRVLLVKPDNPNVNKYGPQSSIVYPPLGLEYIAANIDNIADVRIIDMRTKKLNLNVFEKIIKQFQPDYVGISVNYSSQIHISHRIAIIAKTYGSRTVVGGWHPTLVPSETLAFKSIDIVVRGEGEITMRELIQNDSPIGVAGLSYKLNGKQIHNPDRELMDLKHIHSPNRQFRSASAQKTYKFFGFPVDSIETGRGCPFRCNFCCIHLFYKKTYRRRATQDIINELQSIQIRKHSSFVFIVDDNFVVDRKLVVELCDAIIRNGIKKYFITQARVDTIVKYPKIFEKMADAGFFYLFLGLESFSDQTLEKLNKRIKFRQIKLALKILHDLGYIIQGNIILGANMEDTKQDLESTIEIARSLEIDMPTFSLMTPYPGTKLMEQALREDLLLTKDWTDYNWSVPILKYPNLSSDDLSYYLTKANEELLSFKKVMSGVRRFIRSRGLSYHISRINPVDIFNMVLQILKNLKILFEN